MSKSNVAPLTIANLAMLERQLNSNSKSVKRRASRRTMSRQSAMTSDLDDSIDDSKIQLLIFYNNFRTGKIMIKNHGCMLSG